MWQSSGDLPIAGTPIPLVEEMNNNTCLLATDVDPYQANCNWKPDDLNGTFGNSSANTFLVPKVSAVGFCGATLQQFQTTGRELGSVIRSASTVSDADIAEHARELLEAGLAPDSLSAAPRKTDDVSSRAEATPSQVLIEPWGSNSLRVRYTLSRSGTVQKGLLGALDSSPPDQTAPPSTSALEGNVTSGNIRASWGSQGLSVQRVSDGATLIASRSLAQTPCNATADGCSSKITWVHSVPSGAELYGTGQHMNQAGVPGRLPAHTLDPNSSLPSTDMRGGRWDYESCTDYVYSSGAEICLPWIVAASPPSGAEGGSYEFGLLWNMPNFGSMELQDDQVSWVAHDPINAQIDLFITTFSAGSAGSAQAAQEIMTAFVDATGHSPVMPEWAAGYWHSPIGGQPYSSNSNQSTVIAAVDGLASRNIPTDVYVIDYMHWRRMGDYTFSDEMFPDPKGMVDHLKSKGVRLMVSAWPFTDKDGARASSLITAQGNGVRFANGSLVPWPDAVCDGECYLYDAFSKSGRDFAWGMLDQGYVK